MDKKMIEFYAQQVVDACYRVHKELGPGLLESVYHWCVMAEVKLRGIKADQEVVIPVYYRGQKLNKEFRIDVLIENEIILELKAVEILLPVHKAQLISYLKLAEKKLGFLVNFHVQVIKDGIYRFVNNY